MKRVEVGKINIIHIKQTFRYKPKKNAYMEAMGLEHPNKQKTMERRPTSRLFTFQEVLALLI